MKSLQLLIGVICLSVFIGYSSADNEITLSKLIFKDATGIREETATVSITIIVVLDETYDDHNLAFIDESTKSRLLDLHSVTPIAAADPIKAIEFEIQTSDYEKITEKQISLGLVSHSTIGGKFKSGGANIKLPANPVVSPMEGKITAINRRTKNKCDLRLENTVPTDFTISGVGLPEGTTCEDTSQEGCYLMGVTFAKSTKLSVCKIVEVDINEALQLCSDTFDCVEGTPEGFTSTKITVDYEDKTIKLEATAYKGSTAWEAVIQDGVADDLTIHGVDLKNIVHTATSQSDHNILLVGLDAHVVKEYKQNTVIDLKLVAYALGTDSTIIEVNINNIDEKFYRMKRNQVSADISYTEVDVDCSEIIDSSQCRGYFIHLIKGDYKIEVNKMTTSARIEYVVDEYLTYVSNEVPILKEVPDDFKEFQVIPVASVVTTVSGSSIELDVCFKYVTNVSTVDMHYEFLAVNSEGKWKKQMDIKKTDDSHACFHEIVLPLVDFSENSKFLVLLRDSIKGKPLASGDVSIKIPALRAIKPEVDNGNNGSTSTLAIVGAAIAGIACLMALVAAAIMFVMKINRNNDGLQYPLQHNNIEDSSTIHGLDNSIPTM